MALRNLRRTTFVAALVLASCGRPTADDVEDACQIQFSSTNLVVSGRNFTLTAAVPQSCVNFLTSGEGEIKLRLIVEPANGAEICLGSVKIAGQSTTVTSSDLCTDQPITQQANTSWKRPMTPTPTSVELTLTNATESASADHLGDVRLDLLPKL